MKSPTVFFVIRDNKMSQKRTFCCIYNFFALLRMVRVNSNDFLRH